MRTLADMLISSGSKSVSEFLVSCRLDFKFFGEHVLGLEIMPFHEHWVDCFLNKRRTCIVASRGSGKTFVLGTVFPLWLSCFLQDKEFLVVAASKDKAKDIVRDIRDSVEGNELLTAILLPEGATKMWSSYELKTKTNCKVKVRAFTPKGVRGSHVDYVLADEGGEMDDTRLFFGGVVPTVAHKNGHIMVIGTPKSDVDLLATLSEPDRGYHVRVYPILDDDGNSMWPSKFPKGKLDLLKQELGALTFTREYLCKSIEEGVQPFKFSDIIAAYEPSLGFETFGVDYSYGLKEGYTDWGQYYIGVDLAMSPQGDYSVYTVVESREDKVYLKNLVRVRGVEYKTQEGMVKQLYKDFLPKRIIVDKSVFGEIFISDLRENGIPAEPFTFTYDSRSLILNNLMRLFEGNKIVLPRKKTDSVCIDETKNLTEELQKFIFTKTTAGLRTFHCTGKHDDAAISFAMACWAASEQGDMDASFASIGSQNFSTGVTDYFSPRSIEEVLGVLKEPQF